MNGMIGKILKLFASRGFFIGVLVFFGFEALWVAFSAAYPMAFDEDFHFGIIHVYSQHLLPYLNSQPPGADTMGALQADPSYLYHYVMSFPYRLISLITDNQAAQVIFLRVINIGLFGLGLVLFRKVLLKATSSRVLANGSIALLILIPIVPLLAGQINYDNALFPLVAWICLLVFGLGESLRKRKIDLLRLSLLAAACLVTSVVKYAFLPMAAVAGAYIAAVAVMAFRKHKKKIKPALKAGYKALSLPVKLALLAGLLVASALFLQRYAVNVVQYGSPLPDCSDVIGADSCDSYGPWARNHNYAADVQPFNHSPIAYTWGWLQALHYRLFFVVSGPTNSYINYPPVPLPSAAAIVLGVSGAIALVLYWRRVFREHQYLAFLLVLSVVYVGTLWVENYSQFLETGQPVAINGRYLIPVLLPMAAVLGRALKIGLRRQGIRAGVVVAAMVLFLQAGGVFSFIMRSDDAWYFNNGFVKRMNQVGRDVLDPILFQGPKHY